jgi:DNA processing protein
LLKGGATIATSAADILEALAPQLGQPDRGMAERMKLEHMDRGSDDATAQYDPITRPAVSETAPGGLGTGRPEAIQATVLAALGPAPLSIDELARATGLPMRALQGALLELTLADRIERHGAQLVSLRPAAD